MRKFWFTLVGITVVSLVLVMPLQAQDSGGGRDYPNTDPSRPNGLTTLTEQSYEGYTLVPVGQSSQTLLLSHDGRVVHTWPSEYLPADAVYFIPQNNILLRTNNIGTSAMMEGPTLPYWNGRLEMLDWDGTVLWHFEYASERYIGHHDFEYLPETGNILMIAYDRHYADELLAIGFNPDLMPSSNELWTEKIIEIDPTTNEIVWEWRVWDHLIQDYDPTLPNYEAVADNPQKININFVDRDLNADWLHMNTVSYNPVRGEIVLSNKGTNEIWIIKHGTSTEEARGPAGDLLFRWGNPEAHDAGDDTHQQLYGQHDPRWIPLEYPGGGNLLLFDNGSLERPYSRVIELSPPLDEFGNYIMEPGQPTTVDIAWSYIGDPPDTFFSPIVSAAQRQPNGNTLITSGARGRLFEVTPSGEIVWEYYLPAGSRVFRALRYDPDVFADLDTGQDLSQQLGFDAAAWGSTCADGTQPRLGAFFDNEASLRQLFIDTHGEAAQTQWELEACAEHGGRAATDD